MLWILLCLVTAILLGIFFRYRLLAGIITFAPLYVVRMTWVDFPLLGRLPTTLLEIALLGYLGVACLPLVFASEGRQSVWRALRQGSLGILPILWVSIGLLSVFFSPDRVAGLGIWRAYFLEPVLFYFVLLADPYPKRRQASIRVGLLLLMTWVGALAIGQYLTGTGLQVGFDELGRGRALAVFNTPNALALLLVPLIALFLPVGLDAVSKQVANGNLKFESHTALLWLALACGIAGAIVSFSLGGWGALMLSSLVTFFLLGGKRLFPFLFGGLLLLAAVAIMTVPRLQAFFTPTGNANDLFGDNSANVRLAIWDRTLELLSDRPLTGAGLAGFQTIYAEYEVPAHQEIPLYPHNLVLNFWSELGLLGLLTAICLFGRIGWIAIKELRRSTASERATWIGLIAWWTAILSHGLLDVPYFKNDLSVLFWVVLAWALPPPAFDSTNPAELG